MLPRLLEQVVLLATAIVFLGVPGVALTSLFRIRGALPDTLAVPTAAMFGALVACAATFVQLTRTAGVELAIGTHIGISILLAAIALLVHRRRRERNDLTVPVARGWSKWVTASVVVGAAFAWLIRGTTKLDGLYHISVTRKLIELDHPAFGNINRFSDGGVNPTYALPGWHAFVGWCGWLTGQDPIKAWEIMPVLIVALGALAAAGMARVLLATPRAEPIGALAWVLMRVLFARREVDGDSILFGAVPGQIVFELVFPVLFAAIAVAMWQDAGRVRRSALTAMALSVALITLFHANYIPYVAIIGVGYVAWWLVTGPWSKVFTKRTLVVGGIVALVCAIFLGTYLPILAQIEDFGTPDDLRIDYHLTKTFGLNHIRGGHLYEMLGLPGLVALLATPFVAIYWRARETAVATGGLLALGATCFIPPLFELLRGTGSLTVGLRMNHVIGALLVPMFAGGVLLIAERLERTGWSRGRTCLAGAVSFVALVAIGVVLGYTRFYPNIPGYVVWLALVGIFAMRAVARLRYRGTDERAAARGPQDAAITALPSRRIAAVLLVITLGLAIPVGLVSMRRAVLNRGAFDAGVNAGELECLGGKVATAMRKMPDSSVLLSDPGTSFRAMAVAPIYVVGDYKVWNSNTADNDVDTRLSNVNRFFDSSAADSDRLAVLKQQNVDYVLASVEDQRWLDPAYAQRATSSRVDLIHRAVDSFADVQAYDGSSVAKLAERHSDRFERVAYDTRAARSAIPRRRVGEIISCNTYVLWKVR